MKKFFKALALLLALVLVIGSIPVAAAEQGDFALKGKVNKKTDLHQKIIYIGGAKGVKDDEAGTVCKTGAWANVAKLVKGFDADTMYIELESSDKDIVRTESGKKMAEIQARLEVKRAKDAAKLDENSKPADTQAASEVEEAGMAVQVEAVNNDVTTAVESQIIAEATQEMVKEEEVISEEENKE